MAEEVRIPDIGDVEAVEVVEICVEVGDRVGPDDALIVIESDKASMEVPAGIAGVVEAITVALGDTVAEGDPIARIAADVSEATGESGAGAPSRAAEQEESRAQAPAPPAESVAPDRSQRDEQQQDFEIRVPEIGDATGVVVVEIAVSPGDTVEADDLLVVVESDKASMEIPAGRSGTVTGVHVEVGTEVEEGTLLATITAAAAAGAGEPSTRRGGEAPAAPRGSDAPAARLNAQALPERESRAADSKRGSADEPVEAVAAEREEREEPGAAVYAGPAVRRLARELGVRLAEVTGTGNRGRILKDDVKAHVKKTLSAKAPAAMGAAIPKLPAVDFSKYGPVETRALSRIRAAGAANLHRSWLNVPHVTQFEDVDVTDLEAFRRSLKADAERKGVKLTPLAFIVKACCQALKAHPQFNASLDPDAKNLVLKGYYHIGIAVDTPDGLVVPVIRDADKQGIWELSSAVAELSAKARDGKLGLGDTQGGSFSVSSLGAIGGTGFTPIINAPEVAILGVSKLVTRPVWEGGEFVPREMLPLSLSYDHRAINGAEAGRFLATLVELLADIRRLAL